MLELGVSIADVSAFVDQGSALDMEAQRRATTVYLTHQRIDMLPELLSSNICSLHGDKDRYAVTVLWEFRVTHADGTCVGEDEDPLELDDNNNIVFNIVDAKWAGRSIIRSAAAMTYEQAHHLIQGTAATAFPKMARVLPGQAGQPVDKRQWAPLRKDLRLLTAISRALKARRVALGALDLSGGASELKFTLDSEGDPLYVKGKDELEVHDTIAELMIVANENVAKMIHQAFPLETLVRIHSSASIGKKLNAVKDIAGQIGLDFFRADDSAQALRAQLRSFRDKMQTSTSASASQGKQATQNHTADLVTSMVIRAMNEAKYVGTGSLVIESPSPDSVSSQDNGGSGGNEEDDENANVDHQRLGHYGLGVKFYTHFTSPIRRYADVIVHRQLLAALALRRTCELEIGGMVASTKEKKKEAEYFPLIPESLEAISLLSLSASRASDKSNDDRWTHSVQTSRTADGRQLFEKVAPVRAVPDADASSTFVSRPSPTPTLTPTVDVDDDGDFLDSLLSDVGDDLLSSSSSSKAFSSFVTPSFSSSTLSSFAATAPGPVPDIGKWGEAKDKIWSLIDGEAEEIAKGDEKANSAGGYDGKSGASSLKPEESCSPPYSSAQLAAISSHLNIANRNAKHAQHECQKLFLRLYFRDRQEQHEAVVYSVKENGFLCYVPAFGFKSAVYLENLEGVVCLNKRVFARAGGEAECEFDEVLLPHYQCSLEAESEERGEGKPGVRALLVGPKDAAAPAVGPDIPSLRIFPMQRVIVLVAASAPSSSGLGLPELRLKLVSIGGEKIAAAGLAASSLPSPSVMPPSVPHFIRTPVAEQVGKNTHTHTHTPSPPPIKGSLFSAIVHWTKRRRQDSDLGSKKSAKWDQVEKEGRLVLVQQQQQGRFELDHTRGGRVAFFPRAVSSTHNQKQKAKAVAVGKSGGALALEAPVSPAAAGAAGGGDDTSPLELPVGMFRSWGAAGARFVSAMSTPTSSSSSSPSTTTYRSSSTFSSSSSSSKHSDLAATIGTQSLVSGHAAAMMKMRLEGEEWQEEEDLPQVGGGGNGGGGEGADTEIGLRALAGGYQKDAILASTRMNKLKVDKRKKKLF